MDPEELLVDAAIVEPGDGDVFVDNIDEGLLCGSSSCTAGEQGSPRIYPVRLILSYAVLVLVLSLHPESANRLNLRMCLPKPSASPRPWHPGPAPAPYKFSSALAGTLDMPIHAVTEG